MSKNAYGRNSPLKNMKTTLLEKGVSHFIITIWCTILILLPQAMKIQAAMAAVEKEWENARTSWYR